MQKPPKPAALDVLTLVALLIGTSDVSIGAVWTGTWVQTTIYPLLRVGVICLGVMEIVAGVGFFYGRAWSWVLGLIASLLTVILVVLRLDFSGFGLATVSPSVDLFTAVGLVFPLVMIYSLARSSVRIYLRANP